jgi:uncharacterized protein YbdZ (MbtH family)
MVDWYADMLSDFNVKYVAETWDCDKYAQFMVVQMTLAMIKYWRADVRVPVGWMSVSQEVAWGGVQQGGGKHAVVLVRTDKGLEVIEPQTGDRVPLAKYPNRHRILQVFFQ